ncbi:MAG: FecR domain-containing protein, partial [Candidatus Aminicenantes bacterium]|nr:FecR domain-containing protein [Candidatus Aminicenantes bacterium]
MNSRQKFIFLLVFLVLLTAYLAIAGEKHYTLSNGEKDFYFGHISYLPEDIGTKNPEVLRSGFMAGEEVQLNFPVVPGDVIITYDRPCEIQFDTGTIIRLDVNSRLKVETILAQTLSSEQKLSSLFLEKGRMYVMYTAYNSWEIFQLVTPSAALKMRNHTVLAVSQDGPDSTRISVRQGSTKVLFGPDEKNLKAQTIKKGENAIIGQSPEIKRASNFSDF